MIMNIFAYTAHTNPYPPYVSLNEREGEAQLTVRTEGHNGNQSATCPVPKEQLKALADSIYEYLRRTNTIQADKV